jgi:hypothetical protein
LTRYGARSWHTGYRCSDCASWYVHVEISPVDDEPLGLPLQARWCPECGGFLLVDDDGIEDRKVRRKQTEPSGEAA